MTLPTPTIVILDMDGTTIEHLAPWKIGLAERYDDWAYRISKVLGYGLQMLFKPFPKRKPRNKKKRLLVHRAIHKMRRKEVDQIVQPSAGVIDFLDYIQAQNIPMALVSNGLGTGYGHDILQTFDLKKYFKITLFREDITKAKPNPECLLTALAAMESPVTSQDIIWYIGDRHKDITAALSARTHIEAKIIPLAFGTGSGAVEILKNHLSPEHIILSFDDLRERLERA